MVVFLVGTLAGGVCAQTANSLLLKAKKEVEPAVQIQLLTKAIAKDSRLVNAYHYRADAYAQLGKYEQALQDYNRVIVLRPKDPFRYYARGLAYMQLKKYTLAHSDFSKAISLKKNYPDFYLARARSSAASGRYESALSDYAFYLDKSADPVPLARELIPVYLGAYRYDEAEKQIENLRVQGDDSAPIYAWYGQILAGKNKVDEAISQYSRAINRAPSYAEAYQLRGNLFKEMGDYEAALEDFNTLISLQPDALFYNRRGLIYEEMKAFEHARDDFARAIELSPKWAVPYNNRAYAYMNLKEWPLAQADLEKAISLDPSAPTPYVNLAGVYWVFKQDAKSAYNQLEKAVKHNFKNCDSLYDTAQKGWLFEGLNQTAAFRAICYR